MKKYPCLTIDKQKLSHNAKKVVELCGEGNIQVVGVTKVFQGDPQIARILYDSGVKIFGDARIENLISLKDVPGEKILIRIPMISEIPELVKYADISLNSEVKTIEAISNYCIHNNKSHKVVLMIDMGDRREGINENEVMESVEEIIKFKGVELAGIGVNFGCFGGVIPSEKSMKSFVNYGKKIEETHNIKLTHVTGGSSLGLHMIWENTMPEGVSHLRIGQSIHLGVEDRYGDVIENLFGDVYSLEAEVIEKKTKPSLPKGEIGIDAFGNVPVFKDKGDLDRLILAVGKQDVHLDGIYPIDKDIEIIGGSSDHTILNVTNCQNKYEVGDIVSFEMNYAGLLSLYNSNYVYKNFV